MIDKEQLIARPKPHYNIGDTIYFCDFDSTSVDIYKGKIVFIHFDSCDLEEPRCFRYFVLYEDIADYNNKSDYECAESIVVQKILDENVIFTTQWEAVNFAYQKILELSKLELQK